MGIRGSDAASHRKDRKKRPDELLSSVVRETAVPAAVELLRRNKPFVFPSGTAWVVLILAAADIGGLSKRHGRNEAKGSIIELIGSDQIKTVATAAMLRDEIFGIIPSDDTLERISEYALLTSAAYTWAVVWQDSSDGLLIDLAESATFDQAKAVCAGSLELKDAVGAQAWRDHSGVADAPATTTPAHDVGDDSHHDPADDPETSPIPESGLNGEDAENPDGPIEVEPDEVAFGDTAGLAEFDDEDGSVGSDEAVTEHDMHGAASLADQDEARDTIARRFLSEDLDLTVRLDEFNTTFAIGAPVVQIDMPHGTTDWLSDQVAYLSQQANADLAQLRAAHQDELRLMFVTLTSAHVEQVIRDVATDRDGSRYKVLKDDIDQAHLDRLSEKATRVQEAKSRIVNDYEKQAAARGQEASLHAQTQFMARNRAKMERELSDAVSEVDRDLENAYTHDLQELLRVRRSDASLRMQIGTTRIFEALTERLEDFRAVEEKRLAQWRTDILQVVDDNRKADIAHAAALTEHQRNADEIAQVRREQDALLQAQRSEHDERVRLLEGQQERDRREAVASLQVRDAEWQHSLGLERERTRAQIARVADLLRQLETVESSQKQRLAERVTQLKDDHAAHVQQLTQASAIQGRTTRILIIVMVAIAVLLAVAGFIAGAVLGG
ncbi:hypothetical protein [Amycolatopsis sp. TNS106]|uniref:hypothetical protein n=1 Tax=Amycolatopsis sp. TNS106 TaxID=2861750 RepID=UPI001C5608CE|nr:hypothetical protein [Amycolatopsis sp. TNS106]QXV57384.1 hypothetical protein CVV72_10420 [Amycolatopsis sp. TNS106]